MALHDFRSAYLPYNLKKMQDGRYVVLNREYKPVGFMTSKWIRYDDFPVSATIKGLGPTEAKKLSFNRSPDTDDIYLYNDACNPSIDEDYMADYFEKLELLATLQIE